MELPGLIALAKVVLPSDILSRFDVQGVEEDCTVIKIYLDEIYPE